ncbi:MAG: hypothetical protein N0E59_19545 [Candidatus Thiodiazotropha taylori]|nr:hypothetical protein [Candidatus Thiodiazotropha taylori]MCG8097350.1 hypothetical protein [Candidatus Thiodiazotropha endolucinida]MCG8108860.1 hypothetical protein [Candidatus Thiodiazotropha taylori]MCG8112952.1 hypothetical protein [Candidatus Thiodiazotropha taylori]MCW4281196.1 hypothetical protein [Candidatus Thiodiazotropha taylori]
MHNTQINTTDSAYSTALLCLEHNQDLSNLADALAHCALQSAETHMGPDWYLEDPMRWSTVDDELVNRLKVTLQDHIRVPPKAVLVEALGELQAEEEHRDQWEGLTREQEQQVWYEIADYLLSGQ